MGAIEFSHPDWLPYVSVGVFVSLVIGLVWLIRRGVYIRFYGRKGGRIHGQFRAFCFVSVVVLTGLGLGLSLCEPRIRKEMPYDVFEPFHIVIALDISKSMLAPSANDPCSPSRLDMAVREVRNLVEVLGHRDSDKIALVAFARQAYPAIPVPTGDYELFRRRLEKETSLENVYSMPEGTNHWNAVERSIPVFEQKKKYRRLLIILTDGEPDAPGGVIDMSRREALRAMRRMEIDVFVVGVGEPDVRQSIPVARLADGCPDEGKGHMVQAEGFDKGRIMSTVVDTINLTALSKDLGGDYIHLRSGTDFAGKIEKIIEDKRVKIGTKYETAYLGLSGHLIKGVLFMLVILAILRTP
jgi:hypothetical protein